MGCCCCSSNNKRRPLTEPVFKYHHRELIRRTTEATKLIERLKPIITNRLSMPSIEEAKIHKRDLDLAYQRLQECIENITNFRSRRCCFSGIFLEPEQSDELGYILDKAGIQRDELWSLIRTLVDNVPLAPQKTVHISSVTPIVE